MISHIAAGRAPTRDRLVAAAAAEFAARGFDGATVDRIAARARVNKAMLYYHFRSKAALYRDILRGMFSGVAAAVGAVRDRGGTPDVQLRGFAQAVVAEAAARPHFPPMWLREIAEGGRHLDDETLREMKRVVGTMAAILADGRRSGAFADVHPLVAHIGIVAPILFFAALGPARDRLGDLLPAGRALPSPEDVTGFVVDSTLAALAAPAAAGRRPPTKRSARR